MISLFIRRLFSVIPLLFIVSVMVFFMIALVPGDPAVRLAGENASEERIEEVREQLGLNDPIIEQYGRWVGDAATGDLGSSLFSNIKVTELIGQRFPTTLSLTFGAVAFALIVGIPAGILAARREGGLADRAVTLLTTAGVALPSYFLAMLLILFFAIKLSWLPATGYVPLSESVGGWLQSIALPSVALGTNGAAVVSRQLRSSMRDVQQQDYVRTARAMGLRSRVVMMKHSLKNAAIPVVSVLGIQVSFLLGGTVIIESVFGIAGIGSLAVSSVFNSDLPVIQGIVVVATLVVIVVNLIVDMLYGYLSPKSRS